MLVFDEVRGLLEAERDRLARARAALEHDGLADESQRGSTGELSGMDEHVADVASETFDREVELGLLQTVKAELRAVRRALDRLAAGRFGHCLACGEDIPDDRLRAVPATPFCLLCQDEAEHAEAVLRRARVGIDAEEEAIANLDLLPAEEAWPARPPAEEAAMHLVLPGQ